MSGRPCLSQSDVQLWWELKRIDERFLLKTIPTAERNSTLRSLSAPVATGTAALSQQARSQLYNGNSSYSHATSPIKLLF